MLLPMAVCGKGSSMKQMIYGFIGVGLILMALFTWLAVEQRSVREKETKAALDEAVMETVDALAMQGKYGEMTDEELLGEFTALLSQRLHLGDAGVQLTVDVAGVDAKKGFLSVHITEEFTHPNGKIGKCETDATLVLEQEENKAVHEIAYVIPENIREEARNADIAIPSEYKTYLLEEGKLLKAPSNPPDFGGKHFVAWSNEDGAILTTAEIVTMKTEQSLTLCAVYN